MLAFGETRDRSRTSNDAIVKQKEMLNDIETLLYMLQSAKVQIMSNGKEYQVGDLAIKALKGLEHQRAQSEVEHFRTQSEVEQIYLTKKTDSKSEKTPANPKIDDSLSSSNESIEQTCKTQHLKEVFKSKDNQSGF